MAKKSINMISLMNLAWDRKKTCSVEDYEIKTKNLLSHAYVEYENLFKDYCRRNNRQYGEEVFIAFQRVFVFLMLSDGDFLQGEYDNYCRFCKYAGFQPLSVARCRELYNGWTVDDLTDQISILLELRDCIDPENYEAMVQGFCYLSLSGDKEMDENEYYILRCFFQSCDYCPSTWDQFKREW